MNWVSGIVLFIIIWWTALFAVLPIGTQPVQTPDETSGWRGTPRKPKILMKMVVTTIVASITWGGAYALIRSDVISFRHGLFAAPDD